MKRQWNQTFFVRLEVDVDRVSEAILRPPFDLLLDPKVIQHCSRAERVETPTQTEAPIGDLGAELPNALLVGPGSSKGILVVLAEHNTNRVLVVGEAVAVTKHHRVP
jgi:hypothetical protein